MRRCVLVASDRALDMPWTNVLVINGKYRLMVAASLTNSGIRHRRAQASQESGTNRGRLRGQVLLIGCVGEVGVPASVVVGEGVVEDPGADLE